MSRGVKLVAGADFQRWLFQPVEGHRRRFGDFLISDLTILPWDRYQSLLRPELTRND